MTDDETEYWKVSGNRGHSTKVHLDPECPHIKVSWREPSPASESEAEHYGICSTCLGEAPEIEQSGQSELIRKLEEMDPDDVPP